MKNMAKIVLGLVLSGVSAATANSSQNLGEPMCWQEVREVAQNDVGVKITGDMDCALSTGAKELNNLCFASGGFNEAPGIFQKNEFRIYLAFRNEYFRKRADLDAWQKANPGNSQIPQVLISRLSNAINDMSGIGNRQKIALDIMELHRATQSCK